MRKILFWLIAFAVIAGCGQKKEEVKITKNEEPGKEVIIEEKKIIKENEDGTKEETVTRTEKSGQVQNVKIKSSEASKNVGVNAVVTGYVADVAIREKVAYLNFDNKYPKHTFTAVIFPDKYELFGDLMQYKNKTIEVKGKIGEFNDKPQIILNNKSQLKVID